MAALLAAEHVAGASEFKVEGRDLEARPQIREFLERGQAPTGNRGQLNFGRQQQVGVGAAIRPANASAQLVQLGESQTVGAVDENCIAQRDIKAVLDDGSGNQDIRFVMHELEHHFLQFAFRHLAMPYDDLRPWHQRLKFSGNLPYVVHAVVYEEDLVVALEFLLDGGLDEL